MNNGKLEDVEAILREIDSESIDEKRKLLCVNLWCAYYNNGVYFFEKKDYNKAVEQHLCAIPYNRYVDKEYWVALYFGIAAEYDMVNDRKQAISYYNRIIEIEEISDNDRVAALINMGRIYDENGDEDTAYQYLNKAFSINVEYSSGWYLIYRFGQLAYQNKDFDISEKIIIKALKEIPSKEIIYRQMSFRYLGYIYLEIKKFKKAIYEFRKALKINEEENYLRTSLLSGIAHAYYNLNKYRKAIYYAEKSIRNTDDLKILEKGYFILASIYKIKNEELKEQQYTDKLRLLNPKSIYLGYLLNPYLE